PGRIGRLADARPIARWSTPTGAVPAGVATIRRCRVGLCSPSPKGRLRLRSVALRWTVLAFATNRLRLRSVALRWTVLAFATNRLRLRSVGVRVGVAAGVPLGVDRRRHGGVGALDALPDGLVEQLLVDAVLLGQVLRRGLRGHRRTRRVDLG